MWHKGRSAVVALVVGGLLAGGAGTALAADGRQGAGRGPTAEGRAREGARIAGKVASVQGNTFTVRTPRHGEVKVQHDAGTRWLVGSASDLKPGVAVAAAGSWTGHVLHAMKVAVGEAGRHAAVRGRVVTVDGRSFTMETRRGEIRVRWDDRTRFRGGTAENLAPGSVVGAIGRVEAGEDGRILLARRIAFPSAERTRPGTNRSAPGTSL